MKLSDCDLLKAIKDHAADLRCREAELLRLLVEVDCRKLYLGEGCSSLFSFMTGVLRFSESSTYKRIAAARAAKVHPELLRELESGRLTISALAILAPKLKKETVDVKAVVSSAHGLNARQLEETFRDPKVIKKQRDTVKAVKVDADIFATAHVGSSSGASAVEEEDPRVEVKFHASRELAKKLERAREVLSHKYPDGRFEDVLGDALDLLLAKKDPQVESNRAVKKAPNVKRRSFSKSEGKVLDRQAGSRCEFVGENGIRCNERRFLENDHKVPFAKGGETAVSNGRRLCRAHNQMMARVEFGVEWITSKIDREGGTAVQMGS